MKYPYLIYYAFNMLLKGKSIMICRPDGDETWLPEQIDQFRKKYCLFL